MKPAATLLIASCASLLFAGGANLVQAAPGPATTGGPLPSPGDAAALPLPPGDAAALGFSPDRLARLHARLDEEVRARRYPGAIVLLARDGRLADWRAFGHADVAGRRPLERDAIVRIYSLTKIVTAVAVLMLVEEGRIALDDPLERYLPEFRGLRVAALDGDGTPALRAPARPPTIRHLLTHTSGLATPGTGVPAVIARLEQAGLDDAPDLAAYCARLASVPLALDPGTRFDYDGVPYVVLGRLVETVAGLPFDRFLATRVFAPLGMRDTGFVVPEAARARVVEMASTDVVGRLVASPEFAARRPGESLRPYPSGSGGLYSTAPDLARFGQLLANGGALDGVRLLAPATVAQLSANQLALLGSGSAEFRPGEGFGLGVAVVTDAARLSRLGSDGQYGWSGAASTWLAIDPRERLVAILLAQHLPQGLPRDPPRLGTPFYNLVYSALVGPAP